MPDQSKTNYLPQASNNSIPNASSRPCRRLTSRVRGVQFRKALKAAATPTASPMAMQMLMTRGKRHEFEDAGWN